MFLKDRGWMFCRGLPVILLGQLISYLGFKAADFLLVHQATKELRLQRSKMAKRSFDEVIEERLSVVEKKEISEPKKYSYTEWADFISKKALIFSPVALGILIMHPLQVLGI
jgi:cytidylate kinase